MKSSFRTLLILLALLGIGFFSFRYLNTKETTPGSSQPFLLLYCGAGLKNSMVPLVEDYKKRYGVDIQVQYGGSGTLLSNLQASKQGDLFLPADNSYIQIAQEKGLLKEILPLATMHPVIVVKKGNPKAIATLDDLARPTIRVALGNPDAASIGKTVKEVLETENRWAPIQANISANGVFKPTVNDTANDVKLGAVDAAIIWNGMVKEYPDLEAIEVPLFQKAIAEVNVGILTCSKQPTEALRFARFLSSREGNRIFAEKGYDTVQGDVWAWKPEITFYCGSVNRRAIEKVIKEFEDREGVTVNTIYNGCGILTAQMKTIDQKQGAGFPDVYMACDRYYLDNVKDWFQEDEDISDVKIVIAVQKGNPKNIQSINDLTKDGTRVTVGQCEQCTIGALTKMMLQKEGLYDTIMPNVVSQTATSSLLVPSITTKSADATIAYYSDTLAEKDKIDIIPINLPSALAIQPFGIAEISDQKNLGRRLFARIKAARAEFEAAGFHFRVDDTKTP